MTEASHPRNPLAGRSGYTHLLLRELTDHEVAEFCFHWASGREEFRVEGNGFAEWNASKSLSEGHWEAARRGVSLERRIPE